MICICITPFRCWYVFSADVPGSWETHHRDDSDQTRLNGTLDFFSQRGSSFPKTVFIQPNVWWKSRVSFYHVSYLKCVSKNEFQVTPKKPPGHFFLSQSMSSTNSKLPHINRLFLSHAMCSILCLKNGRNDNPVSRVHPCVYGEALQKKNPGKSSTTNSWRYVLV